MKNLSNKKIRMAVKIALLAACLAVSVASVTMIYQPQSVAMYVALSVVVASLTLLWPQFKSMCLSVMNRRAGRIAIRAIAICAAACLLYAAVISALMLSAMGKAPAGNATLIVLGCQVRGEEPSLMLSRRIDAALKYMRENPGVDAVLAGGQGKGEWISEAEAIRRRLTQSGIDEDRLHLEERSTSTYENIAFSKQLIEALGLPRDAATVTDGFHQYRAQYYSRKMGLAAGAVPSRTPFYVVPYYWLREIVAITEQVVLGIDKQSVS